MEILLSSVLYIICEAADIGINTDFARTYTADQAGTRRVWGSVNLAMRSARKQDFDVNDRSTSAYMETMCALDEVEEAEAPKSKRKWFRKK
ncbi:MAG: hypothetical protein K2K74_03320 [Lachnospiraceae bacterium]|nr:hypothetical protein [Lachnospiraceae bacterium]